MTALRSNSNRGFTKHFVSMSAIICDVSTYESVMVPWLLWWEERNHVYAVPMMQVELRHRQCSVERVVVEREFEKGDDVEP